MIATFFRIARADASREPAPRGRDNRGSVLAIGSGPVLWRAALQLLGKQPGAFGWCR